MVVAVVVENEILLCSARDFVVDSCVVVGDSRRTRITDEEEEEEEEEAICVLDKSRGRAKRGTIKSSPTTSRRACDFVEL